MIRLGTLALVVVAAAATPAFAQTKPIQLTPETVGAAVEAAGHTYTATTAEDGTPVVDIDTTGSKAAQLQVVFFDCAPGANGPCDSAMIWSWYQLPQRVTADKINEWNAQSRWTRAYIDSDKDPRLETDINGKGGLGTEALHLMIKGFFTNEADFATDLGL